MATKTRPRIQPAPRSDLVRAASNSAWWQSAWLIALLLVGVTLTVYWPVRGFEFTSYDDPEYITDNWHVQAGLTWAGLRWAFTTGFFGNWLPLTWVSLMADVTLFGHGAGVAHLVNAVIHAVNGALVFLLLRRMTGEHWRSAFVAALFALHPLRVESVAWVCERRDVLSAMFGLLSLLAYARYVGESKVQSPKSKVFYVRALVWFACSLMSKPMLVTLPFVLLLLDYWPLKRFQLLTEKIPFFALTGLFAVLTVKLQAAAGAVDSFARLPVSERLGNAFVSYARYLGKIFWPTDLALPYLLAQRWSPGQVAAAALLFVALGALAVWSARRFRFAAVGWFWFVGMLVPVIGIVQAGAQAMADRFVYLPTIGLLVAVVWGAAELLARWKLPRGILFAGAVFILSALAWRTAAQLKFWRNSETLFTHTLEVMPENWAALNSLGRVRADAQRWNEAVELYEHALRIYPDNSQALNNLGNALAHQGRAAEAIASLEHALRIAPGEPATLVSLGSALAAVGRVDEAVEKFQSARRLQPDYPDALNNLGNALVLQGHVADGVAMLRRAVQLRPRDASSHFNLGNALAVQSDWPSAIGEFQEALRLQPNDLAARKNLALALAMAGRAADAIAEFQLVLAAMPNDADAHFQLASALLPLGRRDEAVPHLLTALRLQPDFVAAKEQLRMLGVPIQ
ncbi:MAG: hypothetical protein RLZZ350_348 [Verrucomicrobiota bacterium]